MKRANTEIKTLKDLIPAESHSSKNANKVTVSDLKLSAKAWIREIKKHMKELRHDDGYHDGSIDWIEIFFNLNENKRKATRKRLKGD